MQVSEFLKLCTLALWPRRPWSLWASVSSAKWRSSQHKKPPGVFLVFHLKSISFDTNIRISLKMKTATAKRLIFVQGKGKSSVRGPPWQTHLTLVSQHQLSHLLGRSKRVEKKENPFSERAETDMSEEPEEWQVFLTGEEEGRYSPEMKRKPRLRGALRREGTGRGVGKEPVGSNEKHNGKAQAHTEARKGRWEAEGTESTWGKQVGAEEQRF